jgi:TolA-binding protein
VEQRERTRASEREAPAGGFGLGQRRARRFVPLFAASLYLVLGAAIGVAVAASYFALPGKSRSTSSPTALAGTARLRSTTARTIALSPAAEPSAVPLAIESPAESAPELARAPSERAARETSQASRATPSSNRRPPVPVPAPAPAPAQVPAPLAQAEPRPESAAALTPPQQAGQSAAELYAGANRARVRGDSAGAIQSYLALQAQFPASPEAHASRLALGDLYLVAARPELALSQFRAHRAAASGGLGADSAWGVAVALGQLARRDEERAALLELLARYPGSVYEAAARRKLEARE